MKTKFAKLALIAVLSTAGVTAAFAGDAARAEAKQVIDLKDGSTVYIFKDGKMAMEDKYGKTTRMKKDTVMETKDGKKIIMHGDEVMRLDSLLQEGHRGGGG
ncbi:MAG: periplasmic Cu(I)/Cu(II)-binding protein CopK [Rhodocyclaceae bacterium]|nr:periplasmic Cu(I)/Cu(II)-binding protein CopK [Rhodocyclaceae bacterium]